jgi:hypothetical protein
MGFVEGSAITGAMGLLAQAISKCKCYTSCRRDDEGDVCQPECACGFLDGNLLPQNVEYDKEQNASKSA